MATVDKNTWDRRIGELEESMRTQFQNPQAKDIAQHCIGLLQDAYTINQNFSGYQTGGKEGDNRTTSR